MTPTHNGTVCFIGFGYVGKESYHLFPHSKTIIIDPIAPSEVYLGIWVNPEESNDIDRYLSESDVIVISLPTELNSREDGFRYQEIIGYLEAISLLTGKCPHVVIRSTLGTDFPIYSHHPFTYIPEFLSEAQMVENHVNARLIVSDAQTRNAQELVLSPTRYEQRLDMSIEEAIRVKLFSNAYLAMRVAFMNEVDTECARHGLDAKKVLSAIQADPRIGTHYARTSFGYGGKCLPKDVRQVSSRLRANSPLLESIHDSNEVRKEHVVNAILEHAPSCVGVYETSDSTNLTDLRQSTIADIISRLSEQGIRVYVYAPNACNKTVQHLTGLTNVYWLLNFNDLQSLDLVISERQCESLLELGVSIVCPEYISALG